MRRGAIPSPVICRCGECAALDAAFPGAGVQIALPLPVKLQPDQRRRLTRLRKTATPEISA